MTLQEKVEELEKQVAMQDEALAELAQKVYMDKRLSAKIANFIGYTLMWLILGSGFIVVLVLLRLVIGLFFL